MINKIKLLTISFLVTVLSFGIPAVIATHAYADSKADICAGVGVATGTACGGATDTSGLDSIIKTVVQILSFIVGVASVIMIIIGGFRYVISGGDSNNVNSAKNTILYALIGLVIVALAQVIVHYVLGNVK